MIIEERRNSKSAVETPSGQALCYHGRVARRSLEEAYPGVRFRPGSRGLMARLSGAPAECEHLENDAKWMAALAPDTLYLQGKPAARNSGVAARPEASLCLACLTQIVRPELAAFAGRMILFEPGADIAQYFYVAQQDFAGAGLTAELSAALGERLSTLGRDPCEHERSCGKRAKWLWLPRDQVHELDEIALVRAAPGRKFCAGHGAAQLCLSLGMVEEANLLYMNLPYGDAGAYVWV